MFKSSPVYLYWIGYICNVSSDLINYSFDLKLHIGANRIKIINAQTYSDLWC